MSVRSGMRFCAAFFTLALIALASTASAHVTVSSPDAEAGDFGKLIFRVPSESETASTTKITVSLPEETPFAFVSTKVKPGWTVKIGEVTHDKPIKVGDFEVTRTVRTITWSTTGDGIQSGEFDEFELSVGPFAKVKSLNFPVKQFYSDKTVANWDQVATGSAEPEHPAPTLELASAEAPKTAKAGKAGSTDGAARGMSAVALALAAAGLALALRNNRRNA